MNVIERFDKKYHELVSSAICEYLASAKGLPFSEVRKTSLAGTFERANVLLAAAIAFRSEETLAVRAAAALKLTETWILMHDDLMDTIGPWNPYSLSSTLNTSDVVSTQAWAAIRDCERRLGGERGRRLSDCFTEIVTKTLEGQSLDLAFRQHFRTLRRVKIEFYLKIASLKTSSMAIYGPLQLGAILGGAPEKTIRRLKMIGQPAGIAYQILDDLHDFDSRSNLDPKIRFQDLYEGKLTLLLLHSFMASPEKVKARFDEILVKRPEDKSRSEVAFMANMIRRTRSQEYAIRLRRDILFKARGALARYKESMPSGKTDAELFDFITDVE
jgi:geranylgeranyl diphosphate synthase, type II